MVDLVADNSMDSDYFTTPVNIFDSLFELEEDMSPSSPAVNKINSLMGTTSTLHDSMNDLPKMCCSTVEEREPVLLQNGFIKSSLLSCVLECSDPFPNHFNNHVMSLFGHMTVTCQTLRQNISTVFFTFKKHLFKIYSSKQQTINNDDSMTSFNYCTEFLHFLYSQVSRLCHLTPPTQPHPLISFIDDIITHLTNTIQSFKSCDQLEGVSLHVSLHLYWTRLAVLYIALTKLGDKYVSLFSETSLQLMKLLLNKQYEDFIKVDKLKTTVPSLYSCSCCLEVWLMVAKTTDKVAISNNTPTFWDTLYQSFTVEDSISVRWWSLTQLSRLYGYDNEGVWLGKGEEGRDPWKKIQELVTKSFQSNEGEATLRWCLNSCLHFYSFWSPPSSSPLVIAWDYYHRHLNHTFSLSPLEAKEFTVSEGSSSTQWVELIKRSCDASISSNICCTGTSYELFLKLLAKCLSDGNHGNQLWRQLKSRIYSKFTKRKVLELTQEGLKNMISLCLVLSLVVTDTSDVGQQLFSFLDHRKLSSPSQKHLPLIWKGLFSLLLIYQLKDVPLEVTFGEKLKTHIDNIATSLAKSPERSQGGVLSVTMTTILNGIQELVDVRYTSVQYVIGPYIGTSLLQSNVVHQLKTLQYVHHLIVTIDEQLKEVWSVAMETEEECHVTKSLKGLLKDIWTYCGTSLVSLLQGHPPPHILVDTSVVMTLTVSQWLGPQVCMPLLERFGLADTTPSNIVIIYLSQVLADKSTVDHLLSSHISSDNELLQLKLCHSWLRAALLSYDRGTGRGGREVTVDHVQTFTKNMSNLSFVSSLLIGDNIELSDPMTLLQQLLKGIGAQYSAAVSYYTLL